MAVRGTTETQKAKAVDSEAERRRELVRQLAAKAKAAGVPPEVVLITALVESNFKNVNGGDRDSVGMFQQRNAWGSKADRMDPLKAVEMFLHGGNGGQDGAASYKNKYGDLGPGGYGAWAQDVQVSAYPDRYQERLGDAVAMLKDAGVQPSPGAENYKGSIKGVGDGGVSDAPSGNSGSVGSNDSETGGVDSIYPLLQAVYPDGNDIQSLLDLLGIKLDTLKAMTPKELAKALTKAEEKGKLPPGGADQIMKAIQSGDRFEIPKGDAPVSMQSSPSTSAAPPGPAAVPGVPMMSATTATVSAGQGISVR